MRVQPGKWIDSPERPTVYIDQGQVKILNQEADITTVSIWNDSSFDRLWLYNLHYFDDLNASGYRDRLEWHKNLITRWIQENPVGKGIGWESYPVSLRIANWIKYHIKTEMLNDVMLDSLFCHARYLRKRIEYQHMGNHLIANAKALLMAGIFFKGKEADEWVNKGAGLFSAEMHNQVLEDGGHFERSPMYHSLLIEDILDTINFCNCCPGSLSQAVIGCLAELKAALPGVFRWLMSMTHLDGQISLFNDAALGIVPSPNELLTYGKNLGVHINTSSEPVIDNTETGFFSINMNEMKLIIDGGVPGPDYIIGHSHAGIGSFELSRNGRRIMVNSGTSTYGNNDLRQFQRSTRAHNCACIGKTSSSDVYGAFRVGKRARLLRRKLVNGYGSVSILVEHNGYRKVLDRGQYWREWEINESGITIRDYVHSDKTQAVNIFFYLHPEIKADIGDNPREIILTDDAGNRIGVCQFSNHMQVSLSYSTYYPEFNKEQRNVLIKCSADSSENAVFTSIIEFS